jgi:hypothetical protein
VYGGLRTWKKREKREKEINYVKQKLNGNRLCKDSWFTIKLFLSPTHHPTAKRRFAGRHRYQRSLAVIDSQAPATEVAVPVRLKLSNSLYEAVEYGGQSGSMSSIYG